MRNLRVGALCTTVALAVIAGTFLFGSVATSGHEVRDRPTGQVAATGPRCADVATREECHDIVVNGRNRRYALTRAPSRTARTVIVDFGGPGIPVLGNGYLLTFLSQHPDIASKYNFIAVEEPWFTRDPSTECRTRLTAFYRSARSAAADSAANARALRTDCNLASAAGFQWGFDAKTYRDFLTAIEVQNGLEYVGFIGQSFGSVRLEYLAGSNLATKLEWIVLSHPFPVGATADELIRSRKDAASSLLEQLNASPPALPSAETPTRVLPVTHFDELSATLELGYLPDAEQAATAAAITSGRRPALIGRLSDQLWQRYGQDSISPAYLAQLDELCTALPAPSGHAAETLDGILTTMLSPCQSIDPAPLKKPEFGTVNTCIAVSVRDTVAPAELAYRAFDGMSKHLRWIRSEERSHQSTNGLDQCLANI